ncbi:MAG: GNAT family N-acetyltransferase [Alphaproteobacteria bacterium]|nr:GNAT family N-acetyltransferase [Alphaproteobacteria bacterium]
MIDIRLGNLDDARIVSLLRYHFDKCHEVTPPGSAHVFDISRLKATDVDFFAAWDGDTLLGIGAVKYLDSTHGEVKSMHTSEAARRRGIGSTILKHIVEAARAKGIRRLSLETGSFGYFEPARTLYRSHGFTDCEPFGDYKPDPNSSFLTREI